MLINKNLTFYTELVIAIIITLNWTVVSAQVLENNYPVVVIDSNQVVKIWDKGDHNAFTDLIRFNGAFYCLFREASGHVVKKGQKDGTIRIIKSTDGLEWTSVALLEKDGIDLRDPKLSVTPENRLMVIMGGSVYKEGEILERIPQVSFSDAFGSFFTKPIKAIIDPELKNSWDWIWRITWHNGIGYAINWQLENWESGYPTGTIYLMKTVDGIYYEKVSYLDVSGYPNESTIRFDKNNKMYVVVRRERGDQGDQTAILATASAPYKKWDFHKINGLGRIGGPNFLFLDNNRILLAARAYNDLTGRYTRVEVMDMDWNIKKSFKLPSGGDNSYPGMVIYDDQAWISYYSSHEGKTSIYLVKIPLNQLHE